jgi:hypothetical protein
MSQFNLSSIIMSYFSNYYITLPKILFSVRGLPTFYVQFSRCYASWMPRPSHSLAVDHPNNYVNHNKLERLNDLSFSVRVPSECVPSECQWRCYLHRNAHIAAVSSLGTSVMQRPIYPTIFYLLSKYHPYIMSPLIKLIKTSRKDKKLKQSFFCVEG